VRRIYPGFLAAFFVCLLVVAPLGGTDITLKTTNEWAAAIFGAMFLHGPSWSSFVGLPIPALNGSMWSIPVEFNCYLLVIVLGNLGFYKRKWPLLILTVLLLMATELKFDFWLPRPANWLIGDRYLLFRCFGMFCVGSLYYIQRDRILFSSRLAALAAAALVFFLSQSILAEAAFAVLGGYLIFWAALHVNSPVLQRINSNQDISYGVYLYAWPMQSLLVYYFHLRSPALLLLVTIPLTYCIGYASWRVIESPLKNFKRAKKNLVKSSSD
jgi:peptidoglycan/LPS O-acetylase OafA/YrhL